MGGESIEGGRITRSLLVKEKPDNNINGGGCATPVLVLSTLVALCGYYVYGSALGYSSPAQSGIMTDLGLSVAEYSVFASILTFGRMFGAVISGKIADLIGRRGAMWFSEILCTLGWLAILFSKSAWWLYIGRLLLGCGIGLLSYVVPVYIAEITPMNLRGQFTSSCQLMLVCGISFMFLIGTVVTWRTSALIGTIPCSIQLIGLFFVPESPRWLAMVGRGSECEASLQCLRGENADIYQEAADIKDYTENLLGLSETGILDLFQWKYGHLVIVGVGIMVFQQFGGINGFSFYTSAILDSAGFSSSIGTIAAGFVQIPMSALAVLLMDKSGKRPILMVSATGTFLGCFLTGLSFFLQDLQWWKNFTPTLALIGVWVFLGFFALGMGGIPWVIMSEIFPINIKGSAGSLVTLVSWFGSWVIAYTFNFLFEWSSAGTFFIYTIICGSSVLFISKLVPETKRRTLEEMQESLTHFVQ